MEENNLGVLLPEMRLDFWDSLWNGQIKSPSALNRRLKVLELPTAAESPCCRCVLRLLHGDAYLQQRWRYGRDRLRVAVGNLLPREDSGVLYGVCRLTPRHIYVLACALPGTSEETLVEHATRDIDSLIRSMETYLNLESELKEIVPLDSLAKLLEKEPPAPETPAV